MQHLITSSDFTNEEILDLFEEAKIFKDLTTNQALSGKLIVTLFLKTRHVLGRLLKLLQNA